VRALAITAAVVILAAHLAGVVGMAGRPMHYDENEYMHASWLMAAGKTIYRDFFEDHPPHLGIVLQSVRPGGDLAAVDVASWTFRARLLSGAFGTIAVIAIMLFAWRMTRSPAAPIVAAATILASSQIWARGLTDIRADVPTLALFWCGVVLLTWSRELSFEQSLRAGAGIGLAFFANVWNPKWPLEGALMGGLYLHFLWRLRKEPRWLLPAIAPAVGIAAVALLPVFTVTTPRDFVFFNFQFKAAGFGEFGENPWVARFFEENPLWRTAEPQHRWWWVVAALVLAALATRFGKGERRLAWVAIALCCCSLLEIRFLYPYPHVWAQYLVMLAATASLVYAIVASQHRVVAMVAFAAATVWVLLRLQPLAASVLAEKPESWARYWGDLRSMQHRLKPGDTVWISPPRHPVAAFDASYYWYNFRDSVPAAIGARDKVPQFLPAAGFGDLPPCKPGSVRFIEFGDWTPFLGEVCSCIERAAASGRLTPTDSLGIFEVDATTPPSPRAAAWMGRTQTLWLDLCRRQEVFLRGGVLNTTP
jgi:hypothetical protein